MSATMEQRDPSQPALSQSKARKRGNPRIQRTPRKLDREKVLELHQKGLSNPEIAQHQGVATSTVWRCLQAYHPQYQQQQRQLDDFKQGRADVFAGMGAKTLSVTSRILDSLDDDAVVTALSPSQKASLLLSLNATHGTTYDKERLERGLSTQNESVLLRVIGAAQRDLYQPILRNDEPVNSVSGPPTDSGSPLVENAIMEVKPRNAVPDAESVK